MGRSRVLRGVRDSFHYNLISRGEEPLFAPVESIIDWINTEETKDSMTFVERLDDGSRVYVYKAPCDKDFIFHYHDWPEYFEILKGTLVLEYMKNKKYNRAVLEFGDTISVAAYEAHRGFVTKDLELKITFKPPVNEH